MGIQNECPFIYERVSIYRILLFNILWYRRIHFTRIRNSTRRRIFAKIVYRLLYELCPSVHKGEKVLHNHSLWEVVGPSGSQRQRRMSAYDVTQMGLKWTRLQECPVKTGNWIRTGEVLFTRSASQRLTSPFDGWRGHHCLNDPVYIHPRGIPACFHACLFLLSAINPCYKQGLFMKSRPLFIWSTPSLIAAYIELVRWSTALHWSKIIPLSL